MDEYRIKQDGMVVASTSGFRAKEEIMHYLLVYAQDGPTTLQEKVKGRWRNCLEVRMNHKED